jgi:integrase/recombinase XerD
VNFIHLKNARPAKCRSDGETITLKAFFHNKMECIGIFFRQNATLNYIFQKKAGVRWSRTHKCWHVPCTEKYYKMPVNALSGKAILQTDLLKEYLEKKKNKPARPAKWCDKS